MTPPTQAPPLPIQAPPRAHPSQFRPHPFLGPTQPRWGLQVPPTLPHLRLRPSGGPATPSSGPTQDTPFPAQAPPLPRPCAFQAPPYPAAAPPPRSRPVWRWKLLDQPTCGLVDTGKQDRDFRPLESEPGRPATGQGLDPRPALML